MVKFINSVLPLPESEDTLTKIYRSIWPLYYVCKVIGLFPIHYKSQKFRKTAELLRTERSDWLYFVFFIIVNAVLSAYSLYNIAVDDVNFIIISQTIVMTECVVMTTLMFIVLFFTFIGRSFVVKSFNVLSQIDASFLKHGFQVQYEKVLKNNYVILILMLASLGVRSVVMLLTVKVDFIQQIDLLITSLVKALSKYQFVILVLQLQIRFGKINEILKSFYTGPKRLVSKTDDNLSGKLYVLCRLHYKLGHVTRMLNRAFAYQLLVSIAVSLSDILFQSYYLYYVLSGKAPFVTVIMIVCPVLWLLDETIELYCLVYASASTCENANEVPSILHELRNNCFDLELESHIQMYSLQMLHQKLQVTALGFFTIDYTLIYSIIGAVTTYLVIFIQFDQTSSGADGLLEVNSSQHVNLAN